MLSCSRALLTARPSPAVRRLATLTSVAALIALLLGAALAPGAVAGSLAVVSAPSSPSATPAPHPVAPTVHRLALTGVDPLALQQATPGPAAARATRPAVLTRGLPVGRVTAAGLSWVRTSSTDGTVAQVRLREAGRWSAWQTLDEAAGPDPTSTEGRRAAGRVSTEPVSSGGADAVQVRVDTSSGAAPRDLQLVTVDPGTSGADAALPAPTATATATATTLAPATAGPVQAPTIISRAQWGADEGLLALHGPCPGYSSTVRVGFVHHTVGSNTYTPDQSASVVRGVYAYHVQGNGWCDIGYNFLVDRFGRVFEGRHGGVTRAVVGAHTLAFNGSSFGVSAMGTFSTAAAPAPMVAALSAVIGWKLSLFARDPQGTDTLVSAGGAGAKYPAGTSVRFTVVSGHRDGYATECPGNVLYGQLGSLRTGATAYIATHETGGATVPATLGAGARVTTPNGRYQLVMQGDGNLVQYATGGGALWSTGTRYPDSVLRVQTDGNAVVYGTSDRVPLWSSGVGSPGAALVLQNNGDLVAYSAAGTPLWDSQGNVGHAVRLDPQRSVTGLASGVSVTSYTGAYRLVMQRDGNLVLTTAAGTPTWWTGSRRPGSRLVAQSDGNLVVYSAAGAPTWYSGVLAAGATTRLQNDGNVVVYDAAGRALWDAEGYLGRRGVLVG